MKNEITEIEAQAVFKSATTYEKAKAILCSPARPRFMVFVTMVSASLPTLAFSGFEAPLGVKILISVAFTASVIGAIEAWSLSRRLEAVIAILMSKNDGQR